MLHLHCCHIFLTCEMCSNMSWGIIDKNYKLLIKLQQADVSLMDQS